MQDNLSNFLARHQPFIEDVVVWGVLPIRTTVYLSKEVPPLEYITSVRSFVLREDSILVVRNPDEIHIMPGGRREDGEIFEETLHREVLEETGWTIADVVRLGFVHFHHLKPKPSNYKYPHPDFIQLIYTARADTFTPEAKHVDDYEIEARFYSFEDAKMLNLSSTESMVLDVVLKGNH